MDTHTTANSRRRTPHDRRGMLAAVAAAVALGASSSAAQAASDRYATPAGTLAPGAPCSQADPCGIGRAVLSAGAGDTIHIGPGSYGTAAAPLTYGIGNTAPGITYIGDRKATLYVDNADPDSFDLFAGQVLTGNGMKIVSSDSVGLKLTDNATAERIDVRTSGDAGCAMRSSTTTAALEGILTSAICLSSKSNGVGLSVYTNGAGPKTFTVVGSTLLGSGPLGKGLIVNGIGNTGGTGTAGLDLNLSIVDGTAVSMVLQGGPSSPLYVDAHSTIYRSLTTGSATLREFNGTARVSELGFVAPDADLHLRDDSPLVDALGIGAILPPNYDLDGAIRDERNPEPGAYEARSRTFTLETARVIDSTTVQVPSSIRAGLGGTAWWEATPAAGGATIRFGDYTPNASATPDTPAATVKTLKPGTAYVVRGYLEDDLGRIASNELRFTTPELATAPGAATPISGTPGSTGTPGSGSNLSGAKICTVPRLVGLTLPRARTVLKAAGCKLGKVKGLQRKGARISAQSPKAGAVRPAGTAIKVTVRVKNAK